MLRARVTAEAKVSLIGPHHRPLDQERYVSLGDKYGATDYSYYLFADGTVWCFESPNNGNSPSRWYVVGSDRLAQISVEGKTLQQLVEERRSEVAQ
jgi:hypothetical protein